jgi:ABC-type multidrug transport system ATPase subunit
VGFASLFKKAQLSGITVVITSIILAIIVQVVPPASTAAATVLSLLFPPMNYVLFIIYMAYWQQQGEGANLSKGPPTAPWDTPGYLFFLFSAIQIVAFPIIGAALERVLYGTASKARKLRYNDSQTPETVKLTNLSKDYPPNWFERKIGSRFTKNPKQTVHAVNNLNISVLRGQIAILLGANGSGKSTTLDMLAGLQVPTSGEIELDATGGIGLCPQKNVLWDELTVLEHVRIFNKLKAQKVDTKAAMKQLVSDCDLDEKMNAPTRTLSGGQKRKCQLAMMLTGNSSLCMLDEVSSGLDPLSRRKIWDILLAERGKRSILLTTHFLDEADLLSDDITILSKGNLVANGSAVALKHQRGGGYRVRVYHEDHKPLPAELETTPKQAFHDQTVYQLSNSGEAAKFIAELEKAEVRDYQVNGPTIEDVFLNLAEEVKEELEKDRAPSPASGGGMAEDKELQLTTGRHLSFFGQTWVLFRKRMTILQRNTWPYAAALLIPIIAAGLVTLFLTGFVALSCAPTAQVDTSQREALDFFLAVNANIPTGPPRDVSTQLLNSIYPILKEPFHSVSTFDAFNDYISANYSKITPGGFFLGPVPTLAWKGNYDMAYAIATMNLMDVSLLDIPIVTAYQPFNYPFIPTAGKSLQFILYFGLAMSAYPGFFALYTNAERLRNVRALHYSNGVRAGPLWIAYTLFDFIIVLLVSAIAVIIFTSVTEIWYGPGYLFVVFVFYGLSATLTAYVLSLFTTSQLATFAFAAGGQCSMFLLYFISYMCIITYAPTAKIDRDVNIAHFTIGLFFPSGNLLRALLLGFNQFSLLCRGDQLASYPGAIDVYGGPILYLILQSIVMLTVLTWYDSGWKPGFLARTRHRVPDAEETEEIDSEVHTEAKRVDDSKDELRVLHATKAFGSNVAVQDVTFGVPKGEIFSLLGPNGAGKVSHKLFHR